MRQKINFIKVLKIVVGTSIAIWLAETLHLSYSVSAGIIALLSIHNTKKETLFITGKRIIAFLFALLVSFSCFSIFGYRIIAISIFLLLFVTFCNLFSLQDAISMNTVLITHFFLEQSMSWFWIRNEVLILLIGSSIGVLMNLYIPSNVKAIKSSQKRIEEDIKKILDKMASVLLFEANSFYDSSYFEHLENEIEDALRRAYDNMENTLLSDTRYYIQYMDMRKNQCEVLKKIYVDICRLNMVSKQTYVISEFMKAASLDFHEYNNAKELTNELEKMKKIAREEELPTTREEFKSQAILYRIFYELEEFIALKRIFVEELDEKQIKTFWKEK